MTNALRVPQADACNLSQLRVYSHHCWLPSAWGRAMRCLLTLVLVPCFAVEVFAVAPPPAVDYLRDIKPILRERCFACHGVLQQKSDLRVDTVAAMLQGGGSGPAVVPGKPEESPLFERISSTDEGFRMPPEGEPLSSKQQQLLRAWIQRGAPAPPGEKPEPDPRDHWAFRKLQRPPVPSGNESNPIDRFLAARWRDKGLRPAPAADPNTLVRRLYIDLTGLPPTPEQVREFVADRSPLAYEKLVDRLLSSPAYGERWGRHWMDVWRYSDWYGRRSVPDVLNSYGMIWRWRDWIVRSINEDKPYDLMIQQMLAADELAPLDRDNLPATGFLVRNFFRWNYNQWMRDNVEHTGKAFLGLTLNCCQCHDHKYDPITQIEYFAFRAFFEPLEIRHERVAGEPDPGVYPKYSYGTAYKPITSGMVRVYDEKPDAQTFLYLRGDERMRDPGKPPIAPRGPAFLGGDRITIQPINLPIEVAHPGLLDFVHREEEQKRREQLQTARAALTTARQQRADLESKLAALEATLDQNPAAEAEAGKLRSALRRAVALEQVRSTEVATAEAVWLAYRARYRADAIRYGKQSGNFEQAARAASRAERLANYLSTLTALTQHEHNLRIALIEGPAAEVAKLEKLLTDARKASETSKALLAPDNTTYTPVGPTYINRSSGRRLALARWITSPDNPLTPRVAVNYLWGWHFGTPLVESTANFGRSGDKPTHPELLDWLAAEFLAQGWRFKPLHRLIVTSMAYRQASSHPEADLMAKVDPDNRLLWRYPPQRLSAEVLRDGLLHVAGELDFSCGGPDIPQEQAETSNRRTLYITQHAEKRAALLDLFDAANPSECYRRVASIRPQQALALANSELPLRLSRRLANKLHAQHPQDIAFVRAAFEQVLCRLPTTQEEQLATAFLNRQVELFRHSAHLLSATAAGLDMPSTDPQRRSRENLVQALFNHTDFITLR